MRRLKSYSRTSLRFISIGGQRVLHSHQQLRSLVLKRLQRPDVANLFSTPEEDAGKHEFIWYTSLPGTITGFEALPSDQRQRREAELQSALDVLRGLAGQLRAEAGADRRSLEAEILEAATTVPDDSCKFMVGNQPVLAAWGSSLAASSRANVDVVWTAQASEPPSIQPSQPKAPVPDTPPGGAAGNAAEIGATASARAGSFTRLRHAAWLLPVLAGMLLVAVAHLFGPLNGGLNFAGLFLSFSTPSAGVEIDKDAGLRGDVADLEKQLVSRLDACPAPPTRQGSTVPPLPIPPHVAEKAVRPSSPTPKPVEVTPPPVPAPQAAIPPISEPPAGMLSCDWSGNSGGEGVTRNKHYLGDRPGRVSISYETYSIPDDIKVMYRDQQLTGTDGPRSGCGTLDFDWNPVAGVYSVDVIVTGEQSGTIWSYSMSCPGVSRNEEQSSNIPFRRLLRQLLCQ